jgi:hypothetical protein
VLRRPELAGSAGSLHHLPWFFVRGFSSSHADLPGLAMSDEQLLVIARPVSRLARLLPGLEAQHPSLGSGWHRVHERNAAALSPEPGPGQVWLQVGKRLRLLPASLFEFSDNPTG